MKIFNVISTKLFMRSMLVLSFVFVATTSSFALGLPMGSSTTASNPLGQAAASAGVMNMRFPLFLGGSFGLGSGAGVGDGSSVGLVNVRPTFGVWLPGIAFMRLGYGFSSYEEKGEDDKNEIETSNFSVELGAHLFSEFYVMSSYSRVGALSKNGDIAWNEWSLGLGSCWFVFSRTMLTLDVGYHWVREHYDPFVDKNVSGGRIQMDIGFVVFVY